LEDGSRDAGDPLTRGKIVGATVSNALYWGMFVLGMGTAVPPRRYTQKDCWKTLQRSPRFRELNTRSRAVMRKVLTSDNGIATRHLALEQLDDVFDLTPDALHARFTTNAPALAARAAERALADSGTEARAIDAVVISTCTGYLCPGLTSFAIERLGLRRDVMALDLVGQGCGAALPNLQAASALISSGQCERVLSICAEVCTAAFYLDNDIGVLISACLFGDGAGAAVLGPAAGERRRVKWRGGASLIVPEDRDALRFEQRNGMLRNILTPQVPALAARHAGNVFDRALAEAELARSSVNGWILHPGGRDVLLALRERFQLDEQQARWSAGVLREYGNMSSPSVLFALQAALSANAPGGFWWMTSFGAGFSCHGAFLEVE
jgi:predicted naringenin-chalcone synthase